jgi:RNA polymerase sigma factor (sigma-70 family)
MRDARPPNESADAAADEAADSAAKESAASFKSLATRAQAGEKAAFEQLVQRLGPGLGRMLQRRTGSRPELIEELVHRTWIGVWQALRDGRYDPEKAAISTFVYAVAHKLWLQHLRSQGAAAPVRYDLDALSAEVFKGADDVWAALHASELLDAMRDCLHTTDSPFALTPVELQVVVGLASGETERSLASTLGVVASTVHAHKLGAYKKLRRCLTAKGFAAEAAERDRLSGE